MMYGCDTDLLYCFDEWNNKIRKNWFQKKLDLDIFDYQIWEKCTTFLTWLRGMREQKEKE